MNECMNDLSNSMMDRFNDSIGCRRVGGNLDWSDARIIQGELKIVASKFRTIVMDNMEWSWVVCKPMIFEQSLGILGRLGSWKAADLNQICDGVNAG